MRYTRGLFTNVGISAAYSHPAPIPHESLQPLIYQAVSRVISQHPALSTVFLDADAQKPYAKPRYAQLPHLDLRDCVTFVEQAPRVGNDEDAAQDDAPAATRNPEWDQLVEGYHNTRFDDRWGELPLWRLIISRRQQQPPDNNSHATEFIACFVYLHAICDGNSGPAFHRAFLAELQSISQQRGFADNNNSVEHHHDYPHHIVRSPDAPPLPSIEALHRLPLSPSYLVKMAWQDTFPGKNKNVWLGGPISAQPTTPSRFRSMTLPADITSNLVAVSRSHSASLTATVHVLIGTAILANLPPKGTTTTRLKSGIAVSLRRFLPRDVVTEDSMGNWVYIAYYDGPCIMKRSSSPPPPDSASPLPRISWQDAQDVKRMLDNELRRAGKNTPMGCLRFAGNMHKFFEGRVKRPRDGSYLLSNLGVFKPRDHNSSNKYISSDDDEDEDGARSPAAAEPNHYNINTNNSSNWKTGRMIFSEGFDAAGEAIQVTMITGCDGCLTVGFVWNDTVVEESLVLGIFDTLERLMIETAQDTKA